MPLMSMVNQKAVVAKQLYGNNFLLKNVLGSIELPELIF